MIYYQEKLKYLFFIAVFFYSINVFAANPKYDLRLTNRNYISSNEGYFDIVLKHSNPEQSKILYSGGEFLAGGSAINEYDFSSDASQAFYENEIFVEDKYCLFNGDVNQDKYINLKDLISLYYNSNNFVTGNEKTDLTGDGYNDLSDIIIVGNNSSNFVRVRSPVIINF